MEAVILLFKAIVGYLIPVLVWGTVIAAPFVAVHYLVLAIKTATDKESTEDWKKYSKISGFAFMICFLLPIIFIVTK